MPAYVKQDFLEFINLDIDTILGQLQKGYTRDRYASQLTSQTITWERAIPIIQNELRKFLAINPNSNRWFVLLEYPLYRLRSRIDLVILCPSAIVVIEMKVGADSYLSADISQADCYALDLRDFHDESHKRTIIPALWCTDAKDSKIHCEITPGIVSPINKIGNNGLQELLSVVSELSSPTPIKPDKWNNSPYKPVPNVIEAATHIFAGHDVRSITQADADNLNEAARCLLDIILNAKVNSEHALVFLTGVPGSGKTLAGLQVVHDAIGTDKGEKGDIVYLSGNTPLVIVLREALAQDLFKRNKSRGQRSNIGKIRRSVRARIQHIIDFLQEELLKKNENPPHEHVIVFDEAQRVWDMNQGKKKFDRKASEPELILELMGRHEDWCVCICLIGGGQEINSGEEGISGWASALNKMTEMHKMKWSIYGPQEILAGGITTGELAFGDLPDGTVFQVEDDLRLCTSMRCFRSVNVNEWVNNVLEGNISEAANNALNLGEYPLMITRSIESAKNWLKQNGRGDRRYGLVGTSGARRLRAVGLGVTLSATEDIAIAHWYLQEKGDIRSSYALEVLANEYTCQGLELDFIGLCWGLDLVWNPEISTWEHFRLSGHRWQSVQQNYLKRFIKNKYRVLLTRAREGLIIFIPAGDEEDLTRPPQKYDNTANYLIDCGAKVL